MQQQSHNINLCHTTSDTTTTTTPTTDNNFSDAPPPTITDIILPPPSPVPIKATNTTCLTPATSTTTAPSTSDEHSVLTCLHCDHTFTSHIHHRDWRTSAWSTNTQQRLPPPMPSLSMRIHSQQGA
ncbi:unnamed protein product [Schistocephalus solidus]|uniref:C2H2-type domain-containing protein n=1 Tax=Schistocephalus solidus TaxID=70667 RepID=A0A183T9D6_SCHSO|nr:unnamed protein product [Schistocephalus solidus]